MNIWRVVLATFTYIMHFKLKNDLHSTCAMSTLLTTSQWIYSPNNSIMWYVILGIAAAAAAMPHSAVCDCGTMMARCEHSDSDTNNHRYCLSCLDRCFGNARTHFVAGSPDRTIRHHVRVTYTPSCRCGPWHSVAYDAFNIIILLSPCLSMEYSQSIFLSMHVACLLSPLNANNKLW